MKFLGFLLGLNKRLAKDLLLLDDVPSQYHRTIGGEDRAAGETDSPLGDNAEPDVTANKNGNADPSKASRQI
jgi:hypothetical protein